MEISLVKMVEVGEACSVGALRQSARSSIPGIGIRIFESGILDMDGKNPQSFGPSP